MSDHGHDFSEPADKFLTRVQSLKSDGTYKNRRHRLKRFEEWCTDMGIDGAADATTSDIDDYVMYLNNEGLAPGSIRECYYTVSSMFNFAVSREYVDDHPMEELDPSEYDTVMDGVKKTEETREELPSITAEEKELLVEHRPPPKARNALILRLLWQTACREGELAKVRVQDIDRERRTIRIRADKTHENRVVGYQPNVDVLMDQWLDRGGRSAYATARDSPYLFVSQQSERIKTTLNKLIVKPAAKNAGIQTTTYVDAKGKEQKRITAHAIRHGAALQCLENGMDIESLRRYLGHKNLETTKQYLDKKNEKVINDAHDFGPGTESA